MSSPLQNLASGLRLCADAVEALSKAGAPEPDPSQPMTALAVATALGISRAEVYRQIRLGNLKAIHMGRVVRIPVAEFEGFMRRRTR